MFDFQEEPFALHDPVLGHPVAQKSSGVPRLSKRVFDVVLSLLLLAPLSLFTFALLFLNPALNRGPLFFRQERMGQDCNPFTALKFRTMSPAAGAARGAFDEVETDRISRLGMFLRKTRIDELPQIINVLRGEMSLIGPRPDALAHARVYLQQIPGYAARHRVLPGISGYAQTEVGYVASLEDIERKVAADLYYIANTSLSFDLWITWRTLCVVLGRKGQ